MKKPFDHVMLHGKCIALPIDWYDRQKLLKAKKKPKTVNQKN